MRIDLNKLSRVQFLLLYVIEIAVLSILLIKRSGNLTPWYDEFLFLTHGVRMFTELNFTSIITNSFFNFGGQTTGPLGVVGSSLGWILTKDLVITRFFSFAWPFLLFNASLLYLNKFYKVNYLLYLIPPLIFVLPPWWFGSLYSLGEFTGAVIFFLSMMLLDKAPYASAFLAGLTVFFTKLLFLLPCLILLGYLTLNKFKLKNIIYPSIFFAPAFLYVLLLSISTPGFDYNIFSYLIDLYKFAFTNITLGLPSEVGTWSMASLLRTLVTPLVAFLYLFKNKSNLLSISSKNVYVYILANLVSYLWFWGLSDTQYIRYTQFYIVPLIFLMTFIPFQLSIDSDQVDVLLLTLFFTLYLSSELLILLSLTPVIFYLLKKLSLNNLLLCVLVLGLLNILNMNSEIQDTYDFSVLNAECVEINSKACMFALAEFEDTFLRIAKSDAP